MFCKYQVEDCQIVDLFGNYRQCYIPFQFVEKIQFYAKWEELLRLSFATNLVRLFEEFLSTERKDDVADVFKLKWQSEIFEVEIFCSRWNS